MREKNCLCDLFICAIYMSSTYKHVLKNKKKNNKGKKKQINLTPSRSSIWTEKKYVCRWECECECKKCFKRFWKLSLECVTAHTIHIYISILSNNCLPTSPTVANIAAFYYVYCYDYCSTISLSLSSSVFLSISIYRFLSLFVSSFILLPTHE